MRKSLLLVVCLLVAPFLFYWKLFAVDPEDRTLFRGDFLNQHFVWKSYALGRIQQGEIPLWNPHVLGGVPFHANPQVGLFYPPNYLLLTLHDGELSYPGLEAFQLLHQALAGLGMWLFLRTMGLASAAAAVGGLTVMFTGFFTTPGHHALTLTAGWIPLNLFLVSKAIDTTGSRTVAGSALGFSMMFLAGHPQPAYYGTLLIMAWALYRRGWKRTLGRAVPALLLAVSLSAVQLVPTYQLARSSSREGEGYDYSSTFSFSPTFLVGALTPRVPIPISGGEPSAPLHIYVGIGGLVLAAVGVFASRRRERWFFAGSAAAALLLAFGEDSFLFDTAYIGLPGFDRFRIPFRLLGLYALASAALAAMGMESLLSLTRHRRHRLRQVAVGAFAVTVLLASWTAYLNARWLTSPGTQGPVPIESLVSGANWALVLTVLNLILLLALVWHSGQRWPIWGLAFLLVVDLGSFVKDRGQHPYRTLVRAEERPVTRIHRAQQYRSRYVTDSNLANYAMIHGTEFAGGHDSLIDRHYSELLAASHRSSNILGILNVQFVDRVSPLSRITWCGPRFDSPLPLIDVTPDVSPLKLTFLPAVDANHLRIDWTPLDQDSAAPSEDSPPDGDRGVIVVGGTDYPLSAPGQVDIQFPVRQTLATLTIRAPAHPVRIGRIEIDGVPLGRLADWIGLDGIKLNLHGLPRAYFVAARAGDDAPSSIEIPKCWSPLDPVPIEDPTTGSHSSGTFRDRSVAILRYTPEMVELAVDSPEEGFVILADTFHPGWQAEVDGESAPIQRAHGALRAVAVKEGRHHIRFNYRPRTLYVGAAITGMAFLVTLAALMGAPWIPSFHAVKRRGSN